MRFPIQKKDQGVVLALALLYLAAQIYAIFTNTAPIDELAARGLGSWLASLITT